MVLQISHRTSRSRQTKASVDRVEHGQVVEQVGRGVLRGDHKAGEITARSAAFNFQLTAVVVSPDLKVMRQANTASVEVVQQDGVLSAVAIPPLVLRLSVRVGPELANGRTLPTPGFTKHPNAFCRRLSRLLRRGVGCNRFQVAVVGDGNVGGNFVQLAFLCQLTGPLPVLCVVAFERHGTYFDHLTRTGLSLLAVRHSPRLVADHLEVRPITKLLQSREALRLRHPKAELPMGGTALTHLWLTNGVRNAGELLKESAKVASRVVQGAHPPAGALLRVLHYVTNKERIIKNLLRVTSCL